MFSFLFAGFSHCHTIAMWKEKAMAVLKEGEETYKKEIKSGRLDKQIVMWG